MSTETAVRTEVDAVVAGLVAQAYADDERDWTGWRVLADLLDDTDHPRRLTYRSWVEGGRDEVPTTAPPVVIRSALYSGGHAANLAWCVALHRRHWIVEQVGQTDERVTLAVLTRPEQALLAAAELQMLLGRPRDDYGHLAAFPELGWAEAGLADFVHRAYGFWTGEARNCAVAAWYRGTRCEANAGGVAVFSTYGHSPVPVARAAPAELPTSAVNRYLGWLWCVDRMSTVVLPYVTGPR